MMNYKKAAAAMAILCMGATTACSSSNEGKTYTDYMQGLLDARFKAKFATYMRMTESTEDEAQEMYDDVMLYLVDGIYEYYQIEEDCLTAELEDGYQDLAAALYAKADYTVNDATKDGDDYYVVVDVKPMDFFDISYDEAAEYAENYGSDISDEEYDSYTDDDWDKWEQDYAEGMLEILNSYVSKISYGEVISMDNKIVVEDDVYGFEDEDIFKIDDYVLGLTEEE